MYKIFFINFQAHIHAEDPIKQDYALAMRVCVMDVRSPPDWTAWALPTYFTNALLSNNVKSQLSKHFLLVIFR